MDSAWGSPDPSQNLDSESEEGDEDDEGGDGDVGAPAALALEDGEVEESEEIPTTQPEQTPDDVEEDEVKDIVEEGEVKDIVEKGEVKDTEEKGEVKDTVEKGEVGDIVEIPDEVESPDTLLPPLDPFIPSRESLLFPEKSEDPSSVEEKPIDKTSQIPAEIKPDDRLFAVPAPLSPDRLKRKKEVQAKMEQLRPALVLDAPVDVFLFSTPTSVITTHWFLTPNPARQEMEYRQKFARGKSSACLSPLFSLSMFFLVYPSTWKSYGFSGCPFPPLAVIAA